MIKIMVEVGLCSTSQLPQKLLLLGYFPPQKIYPISKPHSRSRISAGFTNPFSKSKKVIGTNLCFQDSFENAIQAEWYMAVFRFVSASIKRPIAIMVAK